MSTKETGGKEETGNRKGFARCPDEFREMFQNMSACCRGQHDVTGWGETMEKLKAACCGPKTRKK